MHHINGRGLICRLPTEAIAPGCTVGWIQAGNGGVMLWAMFS